MDTRQDQTDTIAKGLSQVFGLDPRIAFLTFVVDTMLFGGELLTAGVLIPVGVAAGIVLGFITFRAQMKWFGDERESALIKGAIVGLLTAIPTPLPAVLSIAAGLFGLVHNVRQGWGRVRISNSR
jgi:hypothetical protein